MTSVFENEKKFRKGKKFEQKETKGEMFRKNLKEQIKKLDKIDKPKPGSTKPKNIMKIEKSLENLKKDFRFPKKEKPPIDFKRRQPPNKPRRVPGEQKEMQPLSKGGRVGYRKGGGICKRGMNRDAIGKNS